MTPAGTPDARPRVPIAAGRAFCIASSIHPTTPALRLMTLRTRFTLVGLLFCTALAAPLAAQIVGVEMGFAVLDSRHTINAAPLFLTPGIEVRTPGPLFVFAGVRTFLPVIPVSGSGGDDVTDEDGNSGFRRTGGLGFPWIRAGAGASLTRSPRAPTVAVAAGSLGTGKEAHPWVGGAAGVSVGGAWRMEAEVGWDRNWVEDRFFTAPPANPEEPYVPALLYTRRSNEWFRTIQLGVRYRL